MTVHLIKLSVGPESLAELAAWQSQRLQEMRARGLAPELVHVTRQTPKRTEDVLNGGSIYWVIKGGIVARQELLELRSLSRDGIAHCGLVLGHKLIPVRWQPRRPFQGWRYLEPEDAPPDRAAGEDAEAMPEEMQRELKSLGLL